MASRKHRWPGNDHPLTGVHGGTAKKALRAIQEAKLRRRAEAAVKAAKRQDDLAHIRAVEARLDAVDSGGNRIASFKRKDKVRPKKRKVETPSPWACRAGDRHHWGRSGGPRISRSMEESLTQRVLLYVAQEGICALCGQPMEGPGTRHSLDHVIPHALGGKNALGNLVLSDDLCNRRKSNDQPTACEMIFLLAVNARLGVEPTRF